MPIVAVSTEIAPFVFSDVNVDFNVDNLPLIVFDINAINQQIVNLFSTVPGERVFEPEFGSQITSYLFDPTDAITAWKIQIEARMALDRWMPRVVIDTKKTIVTPDFHNRGFDAIIAYSVSAIGAAAALNLKLTLA